MYAAKGHYGQYIVIIPSMDLVIVRQGMTYAPAKFDLDKLIKTVVDALPTPQVAAKALAASD